VAEGTSNSQRDIMLLVLGALLIACCVAIAHFAPGTFQASFLQMRVLTALGGALLGTALPGIIGLEVRGIRAVGAVSFVVLFFLFTPSLTAAPQTSTHAATHAEPVVPAAPPSGEPEPEQKYVNSPSCIGDNCNIDTSYDQSRGSAR
jgi:peptidoglycan/LPS O-acetylase OafA/YrhL